jgi:hypothetical protein
MNVPYVGCSFCGNIAPLWCSGQLMLHAPVPAAYTPTGVSCQLCGPMSPIFTCTRCWTVQMFYLPGSGSIPAQRMPGAPQYMAPVVQANMGSNPNEIRGMLSDVAKTGVKEVAQSFGKEAAVQIFRAWLGR